jgi:hypothetical protein
MSREERQARGRQKREGGARTRKSLILLNPSSHELQTSDDEDEEVE